MASVSPEELAFILRMRDEASATVQKVKGEVKGLADEAKSSSGKLSGLGDAAGSALKGLVAFGTAATAVVAIGAGFAKTAADEQVGIQRLQQSLSNAGVDVNKYSATWEKQIAVMERTTAFSDGEMRDALSLLVGMTGDADEAMRRLSYAQDLARGTGMDLSTTSKLLGKLTDENVNVLKRYGVAVKDGATAQDVLNSVQAKFGGQAEAYGKTGAAQMTIFKNQVDNLVEDIGGALLPIFTQGIQIATGFVDALRGGGFIERFAGIMQTVIQVLGEMFGVITGQAPGAGAALAGIVGQDAASAIMGGLAIIRDGFQAAFTVIQNVLYLFNTGYWSTFLSSVDSGTSQFRQRIAGAAQAVQQFIGSLLQQLVAALPGIMSTLAQWGRELVQWLINAVPPMLGEAARLIGELLKWIGDHSEDIGKMLGEWAVKFGEFVVAAAVLLATHLPEILLTIGTWVLTEAIPGVLRIFYNLGKGIVEGIINGLSDLGNQLWSAIVSAIQSIHIDIGPFHISASGIRVDMPNITLPSFSLPGFAEGGVVPGAIGAPMLAVVHGGETVTPPGDQAPGGGGLVVHVEVHGNVFGMTDLDRIIKRSVRDAVLSGGFRGVIG